MNVSIETIREHQRRLRACTRCDEMTGPVITGVAVSSKVILIGQAPGDREGALGRPFAWTAGKTLFQWFNRIGVDESRFRERIYMAAVCRCFPGKNPRGGDRVPREQEIVNCADWLAAEFELLQPGLVIPVGKLAISRLMAVGKLVDVIGSVRRPACFGREVDVIALPHPSGASTWHRTAPGNALLDKALSLIENHPIWRDAVT